MKKVKNMSRSEQSQNNYISKLKNKDFTLIARDCIGGVVYHQFKMRFQSPTINLFFEPEDFNYFCLDLKNYISASLEEYKDDTIPYPVGLLTPKSGGKPIKVHFMHYDTFAQAKEKWNERKKRINWNNIYVVSSFCYSTEISTLSDKLIGDWNKIPYKKVLFVDKKYGFDDERIINKDPRCEEFAWLLYQPSKIITWKRTFNQFDFVRFLNKSKK